MRPAVEASKYIAFAIPVFLVLIGVEWVAARRRGRSVYRVPDALCDLGCGIGQQVSLVFFAAALLAAYTALYDRRLFGFAPGSGWPWLLAFVYYEVAYYWWHRASHEVNLFWAAHAVHHQSEDYNLAVALRQAVLTSFTSLPFNLPLALLGVPPAVYAATAAYSLLYQFWIHTELVGKLGPLEWFLNTPSHHRVHHAINPQYLDRNYGAILIVWDRLFGTFAEERERCVFGTTKPLRSFDSTWAQLQPWLEIREKARALPRRRDRLLLWVRSPAWSPDRAPPLAEAEVQRRAKFEVPASRRLQWYAALQFVPVIAATFLIMLLAGSVPWAPIALAAALVFWTLLSVGALLDGRGWARPLEAARLVAVVLVAGAFAAGAIPLRGGHPDAALASARIEAAR